MKKKLALILAVLTVLTLTGCGKAPVKEEESIAVSVQAAKSGEIKNTNTFTGTTKLKDETDVAVEIGGTVETINVEVGQTVHKGDVLLTIKGDDVQDSVNIAKASLEAAEAGSASSTEQTRIQLESALNTAQLGYDEAKRNYEIQTELYNADAISEDAYKKVENAYNQAKEGLDAAVKNYNDLLPKVVNQGDASVAQAKASYDQAARSIEKLTLKSPVDGVITAKNCNENELVSQQAPAFVISNPNMMQVDLKVTANDIEKFTVGDTVNITINEEKTTGTVKTVPTAVDNSNSLYTVEVIFNNEGQKFKAGMAADVEVSIEAQDNTINVPKKAVFEDGGKKYVYIVTKDKKAKKVEVTTGIETADKIEIKSGVSDKDTIVIAGLSLIGDGTKLFPVVKED